MIVRPAFAPEKDVNPPETVANSGLGDLFHPQPQSDLITPSWPVVIGRTTDLSQVAGSPAGYAVLVANMRCHLPTLIGVKTFFLERPAGFACRGSGPQPTA